MDMMYPMLKGNGADVTARNHNNDTPLHAVVAAGDENVMRLLLLDGCDVNTQNNNGDTPLHIAIRHTNPEIRRTLARSLVKSGANLAQPNAAGETPLIIAEKMSEPTEMVVRYCSPVEQSIYISAIVLVTSPMQKMWEEEQKTCK